MRHFLDLLDWDGDAINTLLKDPERLKKNHPRGRNVARCGLGRAVFSDR